MRYYKYFRTQNIRDEARMYPRLIGRFDKDTPIIGEPPQGGECKQLIVLLNPGQQPSFPIDCPLWVESPIVRRRPTNRNVSDLVERCAEGFNWNDNDYARIVCLFRNTGTTPREAFNNADEPSFPNVEQLAGEHPEAAPVVFGWGRNGNRQGLRIMRDAFITLFPNAVGVEWRRVSCDFLPINFEGAQARIPAHPGIPGVPQGNSWSNAVLQALGVM